MADYFVIAELDVMALRRFQRKPTYGRSAAFQTSADRISNVKAKAIALWKLEVEFTLRKQEFRSQPVNNTARIAGTISVRGEIGSSPIVDRRKDS